jgi:hypothetical protein
MSDDTDPPLAQRLEVLIRDLSPLGLQSVAVTLLSRIAKAAEAAPTPVHGGSIIAEIAAIACEHYRKH